MKPLNLQNKFERKPKGQSRMDNLETPATLGTRHRTNKTKNTTHQSELMSNTDPTKNQG